MSTDDPKHCIVDLFAALREATNPALRHQNREDAMSTDDHQCPHCGTWSCTHAAPPEPASEPPDAPPSEPDGDDGRPVVIAGYDVRPRCKSCGEKWWPPEGVDAGTTPCKECRRRYGIALATPPSEPAPRDSHLVWNGVEWVDDRCGCRYHPDDDNGTHGGGPHVHPCAAHRPAAAPAAPPVELTRELTREQNAAVHEALLASVEPGDFLAPDAPPSEPRPFDVTIGQLDRVLSELMLFKRACKRGALDEADRQTLKHHAEDMRAAADTILADLFSVEGTPQP